MRQAVRRLAQVPRVGAQRRLVSAQAVVFDSPGSPANVLKGGNVEVGASLGASQVLIKMVAAPVGTADLNAVAGLVPGAPSSGVCGSEGLGVVEAVGSGVSGLKAGDHVVPLKPGIGTWASHAVAEESALASVPKELSAEQAASLLGASQATAVQVLQGVKKGDTVIHNGAQTPVGLAVAQIAAAKGANVISVVCEGCSDFQAASKELKAAGSQVVIDQGSADSDAFKKACAELKPTLAIHCSSSATAATSIARALGPCGSLVSVAGAGPVTVPASVLIDTGIMVKGFNLAAALSVKDAQQKVMGELLELIKGGKLKPTIAASEPLADFQKAVKAASHSTGTVLLKM